MSLRPNCFICLCSTERRDFTDSLRKGGGTSRKVEQAIKIKQSLALYSRRGEKTSISQSEGTKSELFSSSCSGNAGVPHINPLILVSAASAMRRARGTPTPNVPSPLPPCHSHFLTLLLLLPQTACCCCIHLRLWRMEKREGGRGKRGR